PALVWRVAQYPVPGEIDRTFRTQILHQCDVFVFWLAFFCFGLIENYPAGESTALALEIEYFVRRIELDLLRPDPSGTQDLRFGKSNLIPDHSASFGFVSVFAVIGILLLLRFEDSPSLADNVYNHPSAEI